jgi:3-dehydroquinate dehydratase/shikimate dehydrogenase
VEPVVLRTKRLVLRGWRESDRSPFAALNADPAVMEHFPATLDRSESDALVDRIIERMDQQGFGLWAVEVDGGPECIGFVGLNPIPFEAAFTPALEVGWRLARSAWGHGYAPEAAIASVDFAFASVHRHGDDFRLEGPGPPLDEIVSMTTTGNAKSRRVMEKIGLRRDPADDFDHPGMLERAPHLARTVLYRASSEDWARTRDASAARRS